MKAGKGGWLAAACLAACAAPERSMHLSIRPDGDRRVELSGVGEPSETPSARRVQRTWGDSLELSFRHSPSVPRPPVTDAPDETIPESRMLEMEETSLDPGDVTLPGLGLGLDFGSAQAPYDDCIHDNALLPDDRGGFSDALMQLTFRQGLWPGGNLVGALGATRYQDMPIWDALGESDVAWVMVGVAVRF